MRKVFVALVVALIVGVGGYFGFVYWAQNAVTREVETALEGWGEEHRLGDPWPHRVRRVVTNAEGQRRRGAVARRGRIPRSR